MSNNMLETLAEEIEALKSQLASANRRIATLEGEKAAKETFKGGETFVVPAVKVTQEFVGLPAGFEMPSDDEFARLEKAVTSKYPDLVAKEYNPETFPNEFRNAFIGLATLPRADEYGKFQLSAYMDDAKVGLQRSGIYHDFTWFPFLAAVIAHGDIAWQLSKGYGSLSVSAIGLRRLDGAGRKAKNAWRGPLSGNFLLPPGAPSRAYSRAS
jgi:hypothetical protein